MVRGGAPGDRGRHPGGGGVLRISSDGDDRRIFGGFEIFDSGIFLGRKIWQVFFFGGLI